MTRTPATERFAPSPTGRLHLGHAYSALLSHDRIRSEVGRFVLRMEDLDRGRVRAEYEQGILDDLAWLGIEWDGAVVRQSERKALYSAALDRLARLGLIYLCTCTRRDIAEAVSAPQEGSPMTGPDGIVYPGTCREKGYALTGDGALRLNIGRAIDILGGAIAVEGLEWHESGLGTGAGLGVATGRLDSSVLVRGTGDIVLRRRDGAAAYHLAVVVDDADQAITRVSRGEDLREAVPVQRLLQALLDLPTPEYSHHRLIRDDQGKRLAKRHDALSLMQLRNDGVTPREIRERLGLPHHPSR
ncbi:MAG: tRNA glutamyl-Q(34) synthetase GluQRS [Pseudomonadota bacterium]